MAGIASLVRLSTMALLASLLLGRNQIKDLSALEKVTRLSLLDLKENRIEDLGPLKSQTELSMLFLEQNQIKDLTPLVELAKAWRSGGHIARSAATIALVGEEPEDDRHRDSLMYDFGQATAFMMLESARRGAEESS